jgi:hypothetical protein
MLDVKMTEFKRKIHVNVSRSLKSVTGIKSDGLPSDGLTKIFCNCLVAQKSLINFIITIFSNEFSKEPFKLFNDG